MARITCADIQALKQRGEHPVKMILVTLAVALGLMGCAPLQSPGGSQRPAADTQQPSSPKRIRVAINGDPPTVSNQINSAGGAGVPGATPVLNLLHAGLVITDDNGQLRPRLAEAVPAVENGLWKVFVDGTMQTSWRIRRGVQWHDGTAFTAEDVLFSTRVAQDTELAVFHDIAFEAIASVEAPDAQSVTVNWKRPYISADGLFSTGQVMPKHLLERAYAQDKANFINLAYWSQGFIGTGAYTLRDWARGSHLLLTANPNYVLGRPKIDEIEVHTIPDANTFAANILAGVVDLTLDRNVSLEQGLQIRERWTDGKMVVRLGQWLVMYPQILTPNPPVAADVRFRRALLHAIDRQEMADTLLQPGLSSVAHNFLAPREREYDAVQSYVARYEYDPRRALQLIETLGYTRAPDGSLSDAANQRLAVEVRNRGIEIGQKATFAVADYWQRLGINATPLIVPPQRGQDREYMSNFPGFLLYNQGTDVAFLKRLHSSQTPLPENSYVGQNNSRYMSPEFDGLIDRVFSTIPYQERMQILGQVTRHLTDEVLLMGLFYNALPGFVSHRVLNVPADPYQADWNAHEWDVK